MADQYHRTAAQIIPPTTDYKDNGIRKPSHKHISYLAVLSVPLGARRRSIGQKENPIAHSKHEIPNHTLFTYHEKCYQLRTRRNQTDLWLSSLCGKKNICVKPRE